MQPRGTAAAPFVPNQSDLRGRALAHPVSPRAGAAEAWLVVVRRSGELGDFERLCVQQAAIVVALELMRERVARETERRLSGEVLAATLSGRLAPDDIRDRLAPFGIGERAVVLAFELGDAAGGRADPRRASGEPEPGGAGGAPPGGPARAALRRRRRRQGRPRRAGDRRPAQALEGVHGPTRAATSRALPTERVRHSFHEARCALEATGFANGAAPDVASHRDLGAFTLLLSVQDGEALRLYCESVLGPIEDSDERYAGELLRSLEAYIDRNGHWERAAERLLLPPPHAPLPDQAHRGAHRARPEPGERPGRAVAGSASEGADRMRVAVLGAGGTIAPAIVRDLADSEEVTAMRLLDLDLRRAEEVATEHGGGKAQARQADATANLAEQLAGMEVLVNSAHYPVNLAAMEACLEVGCHYMDLGGLYHVTDRAARAQSSL